MNFIAIVSKNWFCFFSFLVISFCAKSQTGAIKGIVIGENEVIPFTKVILKGTTIGALTNMDGAFEIKNVHPGEYTIEVQTFEFRTFLQVIIVKPNQITELKVELAKQLEIDEIVVSGTLRETSRTQSPVNVEVYNPQFFKKNPTPNIFESLQNVNGVRPQVNCNICSTGDIHINGLEGPYTMILIDGMPIVSGLATVYGLSGIPNSLIERVEIVKGPASTLYGSEAIGGLLNVITKKPQSAPILSADVFSTTWGEVNADLGLKFHAGKKASVLTGINYFNYLQRIDNNNDNFTDIPLQHRISIFQKWNFERKENRAFSLAARYLNEERWGGEMNWNKSFRGGDSIYGESIYTQRWELLGNYQLPLKEKIMLSFSANNHQQDSRYGTTSYIAQQTIGFGQLTWDKKLGNNNLLVGIAGRYTFYDDNTPATADSAGLQNMATSTILPGIFVQDEIQFNKKHLLLLGIRYDYHSVHGNIFTPRLAYKWSTGENSTLRFNAGTGFRVVNLFTEDHAALTGSRKVEIKNELKPESSYNLNVNYLKQFYFNKVGYLALDASVFYTYFNNRIVADYETDPNKIMYDNLTGFAESKGISLNIDLALNLGLNLKAGATFMENSISENGQKTQQILTEKFTGVWGASYTFKKLKLVIDYTGNVYSPMRLPTLGTLDPRQKLSAWWSIQNIQLTFKGIIQFEIYGGVKNLLNWTPNKGNPFLIARSHDPFDKQVQFDSAGNVIPTAENPMALTFDPTYVYGPNQGIRGFIGVRYVLK